MRLERHLIYRHRPVTDMGTIPRPLPATQRQLPPRTCLHARAFCVVFSSCSPPHEIIYPHSRVWPIRGDKDGGARLSPWNAPDHVNRLSVPILLQKQNAWTLWIIWLIFYYNPGIDPCHHRARGQTI